MKTFVGLDISTFAIHAVIKRPGQNYSAWWSRATGKTANERRPQLYEAAKHLGSMLPADAVVVQEEPLALKNGKTTVQLALAGGVVAAGIYDWPVHHLWADVAAWKREVVGRGNASKEDVRAHVHLHYQREYEELDLYDAHCICVYGIRTVVEVQDA